MKIRERNGLATCLKISNWNERLEKKVIGTQKIEMKVRMRK